MLLSHWINLQIILKLFSNNDLVTLSKVALSSKDQILQINETNKNDSSSFLTPTSLNKKYFDIELKDKHNVKTVSLNNWIYSNGENLKIKNAILKIDVQGYELEVIKGADKVLDKFNYLIIELSHQIL